MEKSQLIQYLETIPDIRSIKTTGERHVSIPCLMARWRHQKGYDNKPSMTISHGEGPSFVTCWSCGYKKPLTDALFELNTLCGGSLAQLAVAAQEKESAPYIRTLAPATSTTLYPSNYDDTLVKLQQFPWTATAINFLESKGVLLTTAIKAGGACLPAGTVVDIDERDEPLTVYTDTIVFPVMSNVAGSWHCVGAQARPLKTGGIKYYAILPFSAEKHLFGEAILSRVRGKTLLLVEGNFDVWHLLQEKLPTVGLMGTSLSLAKIRLIYNSAPATILLMLDPDKPGQDASAQAEKLLKNQNLPVIPLKLDRDPKFYTKSQILSLVPELIL
jgi:hypothetical protein